MARTFTVVEWGSREWGSRDSTKPTFLFSIFSFITLFVQVEAGWPNRRSFLEWLRRLTPVITQESRFTSKYSWAVPLIRAGRASDIASLIAQAHQVGPDESWCLSPWVLVAGLCCRQPLSCLVSLLCVQTWNIIHTVANDYITSLCSWTVSYIKHVDHNSLIILLLRLCGMCSGHRGLCLHICTWGTWNLKHTGFLLQGKECKTHFLSRSLQQIWSLPTLFHLCGYSWCFRDPPADPCKLVYLIHPSTSFSHSISSVTKRIPVVTYVPYLVYVIHQHNLCILCHAYGLGLIITSRIFT